MKLNSYILLFCSAFLFSCGYAEKEEDKYPDLPLFPETSNSKFLIEAIPYKHCRIKGYYNNLLYTKCDSVIKSKNTSKSFFVLFDEDFNEVKKIPVKDYIHVNGSGDIIEERDSLVIRYNYPEFAPIEYKKFPISFSTVRNENYPEIKRRHDQDSTFNSHYFVHEKYEEAFKKFAGNNLECYDEIDKFTIFTINGTNYWARKEFDLENTKKCFYTDHKEQEDLFRDDHLIKFEDAILGNKSSGNHVAFGYSQYGLEYFNLTLKNDTTTFKNNSRSLDGKSLIAYKGFNDNQLILITEYSSEIYFVKYKK